LYGLPVSRTVPEPYRIFILTVLYGFGPYRTVTVPYIRSENGDTAYKHSPVINRLVPPEFVLICVSPTQ
jgi:hypothetical protein